MNAKPPAVSQSDNPNLIPPSGPNWRLIGAAIVALAIIGSIVSIPLYERWQTEKAAHIERGKQFGALYPIEINGQPYELELGWGRKNLIILTEPLLPTDTQITVSGDFGTETLAWNEEYKIFGPSQLPVDPAAHHKVTVTIKDADGNLLWKGKRWAWGIVSEHHHH
ncbi:hypothetical protein [Ruficoccus sp. ZRK36]|uniref:hypothetical protein n=1 Tax=Ruficoccus sp. ZRK36 TaxID=2866311 RepID=UPI001C72F26A|nr:hypothetical protein [Ruficoccus sp. ZRK36]QYY35442.1 hypothetical protein K0V07_14235 [Ruficoccus sp. ZRK36]